MKEPLSVYTQELDDNLIDLLVITAGIQEVDNLQSVDLEGLRRQMDVNAYGPLFVVQALRGHLREGSHVRALSNASHVVIIIHHTAALALRYEIAVYRSMIVLFGHSTKARIIAPFLGSFARHSKG